MAVGGISSRSLMLHKQPVEPQVKPENNVAHDDATPAASVQRFVENSDEMAASLRGQFRRRGEFGSRLDGLADNFERVLDEDVVPKAQQVLALAKLGDRGIEWLLAQVRSLFADDSDLVLVLRELLRSKVLAESARKRLETMLQQVLQQSPQKRLKAGINVALKAKMFGKRLKMRAVLLRETYRSFLESEGGAVESYEDWIAVYGYEARGTVLEFVEDSTLTDINAQDPSCSRDEFGPLLQKLSELKRLRSAEALFIQRVLGGALITQHNTSEPDWLVFLLGLVQYPDELEQLFEGVFDPRHLHIDCRERGQLLQALRVVCLGLPPELFADDGALERLAAQFASLSDLVFKQEAIERHTALTDGFKP